MAKAKSKKTQPQQQKSRRPRAKKNNSSPQSRYASLLHNPDNGDHMFDIYDGERGETQKFVSSLTINTTTGHTAGFLTLCGATGNGASATNTSSGLPLTWALTNVGYPGANFLTANASKIRCKALKLELIPSAASFSNITGEVAAGVTTNASFVPGTTTVDHLFDIAKAYGPLNREIVHSRWFPSGLDHTYTPYNTFASEDNHFVFIAYRGWPAGVQLTVRMSYVVEYTVKNTIGIPPTGAVSVPIGHQQVLSALQQRDPHWHHSILDEVKSAGVGIARDMGVFGRQLARQGMMKAASKFFVRSAEGALVLA